jgi:hypothetical protein
MAQTVDERFDEGILLRLARSDVMPADLVILGPSQDRFAGELCTISSIACNFIEGSRPMICGRLYQQSLFLANITW